MKSGKAAYVCPVCGREGMKAADQGPAVYYHRCSFCDTVWLSDRSEYELARKDIYDENYVTKMNGAAGINGYRRLAERYFYLLHYLACAAHKRRPGPFTFAEIGFSLPSVFTYFFNYGYDVTAMDMRVPDKLRNDLNMLVESGRLHFVEGDFEKWDTAQRFDVLWLSHVLEHFEDTLEVLRKIKGLLKETGVAFISSPDAENMKDFGVPGLLGHLHPKEHLFMYSLKTFGVLCAKAGLKVCFRERYQDPVPGKFEFVTKMEWRALIVPQERHLS